MQSSYRLQNVDGADWYRWPTKVVRLKYNGPWKLRMVHTWSKICVIAWFAFIYSQNFEQTWHMANQLGPIFYRRKVAIIYQIWARSGPKPVVGMYLPELGQNHGATNKLPSTGPLWWYKGSPVIGSITVSLTTPASVVNWCYTDSH